MLKSQPESTSLQHGHWTYDAVTLYRVFIISMTSTSGRSSPMNNRPIITLCCSRSWVSDRPLALVTLPGRMEELAWATASLEVALLKTGLHTRFMVHELMCCRQMTGREDSLYNDGRSLLKWSCPQGSRVQLWVYGVRQTPEGCQDGVYYLPCTYSFCPIPPPVDHLPLSSC